MTSKELMRKFKEFGIRISYEGFQTFRTCKVRKWVLTIPYIDYVYREPDNYTTAVYGSIEDVEYEINCFLNMWYNSQTNQIEMIKGYVIY